MIFHTQGQLSVLLRAINGNGTGLQLKWREKTQKVKLIARVYLSLSLSKGFKISYSISVENWPMKIAKKHTMSANFVKMI